jgi:hypothetical protein
VHVSKRDFQARELEIELPLWKVGYLDKWRSVMGEGGGGEWLVWVDRLKVMRLMPVPDLEQRLKWIEL